MSNKISTIAENPCQLSLFQSFYGTEAEKGLLSNTIDLWDATPKYFLSRKEMAKLRSNGLLPSVEREFEFRDKKFHVRIAPALLRTKDGDLAYYPSSREEVVEDALRKIAAKQNYGFIHHTGDFGVRFTLHQLRMELYDQEHAMTSANLVESLMILAGCSIEITPDKEKAICKSAILTSLVGVGRDHLAGNSSQWSAYFNPMVAESIKTVTYRQYDYDKVMGYRSQAARWLHKRLAYNYTNASMIQPYHILLSTVRKSSHLLNHSRIRDQVSAMDAVIQELLEEPRNTLIKAEKLPVQGERSNSIRDVKYTLYPSPGFVGFVKAANKRQSDGKSKLTNHIDLALPRIRRNPENDQTKPLQLDQSSSRLE